MTSSFRITLLPGDGIGPEITAVARQLLDAVSRRHGFQLEYDEQPMGGSAIDATGEPLPASTLAACGASDAVLLAAVANWLELLRSPEVPGFWSLKGWSRLMC